MADGITRIAVEGFKSIANRLEIEIAPLTILAGANSSGKSSIMQPLLMLKQTLEWVSDEGPLFISGPHVKFTSADQFLSRVGTSRPSTQLTVELALQHAEFRLTLHRSGPSLEVHEQKTADPKRTLTLRTDMTAKEIAAELHQPSLLDGLRVTRNRFFLGVASTDMPWASVAEWVVPVVRTVVHVPALRGNPSRTYRASAIYPDFPGAFESYVASLIAHWQSESRQETEALNADMKRIGLGQKVQARKINDTEIEL
jgi:hypothetical protein